jgi:exopolyphosphatase/pppGpp-phosphohydrolase
MPALTSFCGRKVRLVGSGGTVAVLAKLAAGAGKVSLGAARAAQLDIDQVRRTADQLWSLPLAERLKIKSIPPQRADLVLMGSAILEQMLVQLGFAELTISRRGMRYGAALARLEDVTPEVSPENVSTASLFRCPAAESFEAMPLTHRVSSQFPSFNTPTSTSSASVV